MMDATPRLVQVWSEERVQYPPKGRHQLAVQQALKQAVPNLDVADDELLHGSYLSRARDACDAENAVVYNIGASSLRRPARSGIRFERGFGAVEPPEDTPTATHLYRYEPAPPSGGFRYWRRGGRFARVDSAGCGPLTEFTKVALVWHAVKTAGDVQLDVSRVDPETTFELSATLYCADDARPNPAAIIKPLFDGIIPHSTSLSTSPSTTSPSASDRRSESTRTRQRGCSATPRARCWEAGASRGRGATACSGTRPTSAARRASSCALQAPATIRPGGLRRASTRSRPPRQEGERPPEPPPVRVRRSGRPMASTRSSLGAVPLGLDPEQAGSSAPGSVVTASRST